jgi:hypothetical protein
MRVLRIVRTQILVETWNARLPDVDEIRPQQCPSCQGRHQENGCAIHGHGTRKRTLWGPAQMGGEPTVRVVVVRRYRCVSCRCILVVVPAEVGQHVNFTLPVILVALVTWALERVTAGAVLSQLSPSPRRGNSDPWLWSSIRRWVERRRVLFPQVDIPDQPTMRETAAALVAAMAARMNPAPAHANAASAWQSALGP